MSKADVTCVCTLAAHLAQRQPLRVNLGELPATALFDFNGSRCAADAMALQRLGRSTLNAVRRYSGKGTGNRYKAERVFASIADQTRRVLEPYGLKSHFQDDAVGPALYIDGLPDNTQFTGEGYGI